MVERYVDIVVISSIITPTNLLVFGSLRVFTYNNKNIINLRLVIIAKGLYDPFELGSQVLQRRWYFVLRHGRVGLCQALKIMKIASS